MEKEIAGYIRQAAITEGWQEKSLTAYQNQTFYAHIRNACLLLKNVYLSVEQAAL